MAQPFNFIKQHQYCIIGNQAIKRHDGVYTCVKWGGECKAIKCARLHQNGIKKIETDGGLL